MKVYSCPKEVPAPEVDYRNYDHDKVLADEKSHSERLKAYLIKMGYTGAHTGEEYNHPHADGHARYMVADVPKGARKGTVSVLIHLPYGDAWNSRDVQHLPKTEVFARIAASKKFHALLSKKEGNKP